MEQLPAHHIIKQSNSGDERIKNEKKVHYGNFPEKDFRVMVAPPAANRWSECLQLIGLRVVC